MLEEVRERLVEEVEREEESDAGSVGRDREETTTARHRDEHDAIIEQVEGIHTLSRIARGIIECAAEDLTQKKPPRPETIEDRRRRCEAAAIRANRAQAIQWLRESRRQEGGDARDYEGHELIVQVDRINRSIMLRNDITGSELPYLTVRDVRQLLWRDPRRVMRLLRTDPATDDSPL